MGLFLELHAYGLEGYGQIEFVNALSESRGLAALRFSFVKCFMRAWMSYI